MPFVAAKCTQCGGVLNVDPAHDVAVCRYCNMPFIIEKAINNYITTVNINIYERGAAVDTLIEQADVLLKARNFSKADKIFDKVLEWSPHDHRAHWGKLSASLRLSDSSEYIIRWLVKSRYKIDPSMNADDDVRNFTSALCHPHYNNAVRYAPDNNIRSEYMKWHYRVTEAARRRRDDVMDMIRNNEKASSIIHEISEIEAEIYKIETEMRNIEEKTETEGDNLIVEFIPTSVLSVIAALIVIAIFLHNGLGILGFVFAICGLTLVAFLLFCKKSDCDIAGFSSNRNALAARIQILEARIRSLEAEKQQRDANTLKILNS